MVEAWTRVGGSIPPLRTPYPWGGATAEDARAVSYEEPAPGARIHYSVSIHELIQ